MARGINLRAALRLPAEWPAARVALERWGTALPLGAAGFSLSRATNASSVPDASAAPVPFTVVLDDAETWVPNGASSIPSVTVPRGLSGVYHLEASVSLASSAGNWSLSINVNGSAVAVSERVPADIRRTVVAMTSLREGDVVSVQLSNGSGGALTPVYLAATSTVARTPFFRGHRVSLL